VIEMELSKVEFALVEKAADGATGSSMLVLNELELALVGGGSGETILH
jgi:hypothetical protein